MRLQGFDHEHALQRFRIFRSFDFCGEPVVYQSKQLVQTLFQEIAVLVDLAVAFCLLTDLPQAFKGVSGFVCLRFHRSIAQLRLCFNEKHEQDAVHVPEALERQILSQRPAKNAHVLAFSHVVNHFIAKDLDALPQGVF